MKPLRIPSCEVLQRTEVKAFHHRDTESQRNSKAVIDFMICFGFSVSLCLCGEEFYFLTRRLV